MATRTGVRDVGFSSRRGKDVKLRYSTDNNNEFIVSVRTFIDNGGNPIPTKPPLWNARIETGGTVCATKLKGMRNLEICIPNANNKQGFSLFNLPIPYNDNNLLETIKEFAAIPENKQVKYTGESICHEFVL